MQIIQERNPWEGFAQGFNQGMQNLTQGIIKGRERSNFAKSLEKLNLTEDEARAVATAPAPLQNTLIKSFIERKAGNDYLSNLGLGTPQEQLNVQQVMTQPGMQQEENYPLQQPAPQDDMRPQLALMAQQKRQQLLAQMVGGGQQGLFGEPQVSPRMQNLQSLTQMPQFNNELMQRIAERQVPQPQEQYQQPQQDQYAQPDQPPMQPQEQPVDQMQPRRKSIKDYSADELGEIMANAPTKQIADRLKPLYNEKKKEETRLEAKATKFESKLNESITKSEDLRDALNELESFAKTHKNLFGPYAGAIKYVTEDARNRDRLISNVVTKQIAMGGSIGRGSNMMINLQKSSKPSEYLSYPDLIKAVRHAKKLAEIPSQQLEDLSMMREAGLKPNFQEQLMKRAIDRYRSLGAEVFEEAEGAQEGQTKVVNGKTYQAVYEDEE